MKRSSRSLFIALLSMSIVAVAQTQTAPPAAEAGQKAAVAVPVIVLHGTLSKGLNSKNATLGQTFVVKTDEDLKLTNGTAIPAGSDISGHVLQSTARSRAMLFGRMSLTCPHEHA